MCILTLLTLMYFIVVIVQCNPVSYFWLQFSGQVGNCFPDTTVQNITISYAVFAAVTDVIFGVLPIFVIWNLKMNKKAKMVVGALLALGIMLRPAAAGFTVIIRIEYVRLVNLTVDFLFAVSNMSI
ncbi:hypothetical protein N431DRAFT_510234 [Stipitochalara longipes BDJ]|nr:hypothetical protein N431DRAFT_510234 [Stipitochalara longipes BDJ]